MRAAALSALLLSGGAALAAPLDTLEAMRRHLEACYRPAAVGFDTDVTVRFALRRDGRLLGPPRVSYVGGAPDPEVRRAIVDAAIGSMTACAPLSLTDGLGGAIAGRTFTIRFVGRRASPLA
jgi:hypothetical protein